MRRHLIWMQAAMCAVTFSMAAPLPAATGNGQPPPHAQANGKSKAKKAKKVNKAKAPQDHDHGEARRDRAEGRRWDPRFHGLDRNGNNAVSRDEWNGDDRSFANHDWNRDGVLSGDELIVNGARPDAPRGTRPRPESDEALFARMDGNRDNRLSRSEWNGTASEFDRLDANRDGVLSPYEFGIGR